MGQQPTIPHEEVEKQVDSVLGGKMSRESSYEGAFKGALTIIACLIAALFLVFIVDSLSDSTLKLEISALKSQIAKKETQGKVAIDEFKRQAILKEYAEYRVTKEGLPVWHWKSDKLEDK